VIGLGDPWVDPASIPELAEILRRQMLNKVRILEIRCEKSDRLVQVLRVNGRPLALTQRSLMVGGIQAGVGPTPTRLAHREIHEAMWLDLPPDVYRVTHAKTTIGVLRIAAQCVHGRTSIPADWLIHELEAGTKKIIL
jgi:hypothetical protein